MSRVFDFRKRLQSSMLTIRCDNLKIAFIVDGFPKLSETFILNQITGLLDLGHEVDIYATHKLNNSKAHTDVKAYNLLNRTYYPKTL